MDLEPIRRAVALMFVLPLLGGCFVTSENPVIRPGEDGRDPALRGLWVTPEGREFLHVLHPELDDDQKATDEAPGFSGLYIVSGGDEAKDRDGWARVRMMTTKVKDRTILSMRFQEGESGGDLEDMPGWLIFDYRVTGGRFYLHMLDEDPINAAIEAGRLPGKPKSGSYGDPHVTAGAGEWIAFLEKADLSTLFHDEDDSYLIRLSSDQIKGVVAPPEETAPKTEER